MTMNRNAVRLQLKTGSEPDYGVRVVQIESDRCPMKGISDN